MFLLTPAARLLDLTQPWFWVFTLIILVGAVVENMRNIALSTTVTILIEPDRRANANGLVGMVQGLMFIVTSLLSGLSVGLLGMGWTIVVAIVLTALAFAHLLMLRMPEEVRAAATDAHGGFDLRGSLAAVLAISGLFALILFSTFNNFIGGVYMALMDPYGLEMFPVELWGTYFALGATGFIVGGALIGKFGLGSNPLRTMLIAVIVMGVLGAVFTLREWAWLYIAGIWLYLVLVPFVEAAEQTVIQQVVPLNRQGRVFGFAMAFESAAAPITAFLIAPIAQVWIIPYARSAEGAAQLAPLLGEGTSRGIALVFLVAGIIMIAAAVLAFLTPVYRRVSASYARTAAEESANGEHLVLVPWLSPDGGRGHGSDHNAGSQPFFSRATSETRSMCSSIAAAAAAESWALMASAILRWDARDCSGRPGCPSDSRRVSRIIPAMNVISWASTAECAAAVTAWWNSSSPCAPLAPEATSSAIASSALSMAFMSSVAAPGGGQLGKLDLERASRLHDLGQPAAVLTQALDHGRNIRTVDQHGTRAVLDVDHAEHFQRHQGLGQRCPRNAQPLGEFTLSRQGVPGAQLGSLDEVHDLLHELLIEPGPRNAGDLMRCCLLWHARPFGKVLSPKTTGELLTKTPSV